MRSKEFKDAVINNFIIEPVEEFAMDEPLIDLRQFTRDPAEFQEWFNHKVRGQIFSSFDVLCAAAASCGMHAYREVGQLLLGYNRFIESAQISRAEWAFVQGINYQHNTLGPLLSATLLPAFALEALIRLLAEVALTSRIKSEEDIDSIALALAGFDALNANQRVERALSMAGIPCPAGIKSDCVDLIEYRNRTVHASPEHVVGLGNVRHFKRGDFKQHVARNTRYPTNVDVLFGISPRHVTVAIDAHDNLLSHLLENAHPGFRAVLEKRYRNQLQLIRKRTLKFQWESVTEIETGWDIYSTFIEEISEEELEAFYAKMNRQKMRKVQDVFETE